MITRHKARDTHSYSPLSKERQTHPPKTSSNHIRHLSDVRCVLPLVVRLSLKICIITCLICHYSLIALYALHIISFSETNDLCSAVVVCMIGSYILSHMSLCGLHVISFSETNYSRGVFVVFVTGADIFF